MKKCSKCKTEKKLNMFAKDKNRWDGLQYYCRECVRGYSQSSKGKAAVRKYNASTEGKASKAKYNAKRSKTVEGRTAQIISSAKYQANNPHKVKAHTMVSNAIKMGSLINPSQCSLCTGGRKPEAHHDDYNFPLKVRWLCRPCHKAWHRENKAIQFKK